MSSWHCEWLLLEWSQRPWYKLQCLLKEVTYGHFRYILLVTQPILGRNYTRVWKLRVNNTSYEYQEARILEGLSWRMGMTVPLSKMNSRYIHGFISGFNLVPLIWLSSWQYNNIFITVVLYYVLKSDCATLFFFFRTVNSTKLFAFSKKC